MEHRREGEETDFEQCMEWINHHKDQIQSGKYGKNEVGVQEAITRQEQMKATVEDFQSRVNGVIKQLDDDSEEKRLSDAYAGLLELSRKKLNCLKTMLEITSLEHAIANIGTEFDTNAVHMKRKPTDIAEGEERIWGFMSPASQDCVFAARDNWNWIMKLMQCVQVHLENAAKYQQFFHEVDESEVWMSADIQKLNDMFDITVLKGEYHDAQRLLDELQELLIALRQWESKITFMWDSANKIVPVHLRVEGIPEPTPCRSLADFETEKISTREGEDLLLLKNNNPRVWTVRNNKGQEGDVPAVTCLIPGPYKEAVEAATRLRLKLLQAWTGILKKIGMRLIVFMLKVFKSNYNDEEVGVMRGIRLMEKRDLLRILDFIEDTLSVHWGNHKAFQDLQERILALRMILEEAGDHPLQDEKASSALVVQVGLLEKLMDKYKDMWADWEMFKCVVESSNSPELMLIVDKWEQLKFVNKEYFTKYWQMELDAEEGAQRRPAGQSSVSESSAVDGSFEMSYGDSSMDDSMWETVDGVQVRKTITGDVDSQAVTVGARRATGRPASLMQSNASAGSSAYYGSATMLQDFREDNTLTREEKTSAGNIPYTNISQSISLGQSEQYGAVGNTMGDHGLTRKRKWDVATGGDRSIICDIPVEENTVRSDGTVYRPVSTGHIQKDTVEGATRSTGSETQEPPKFPRSSSDIIPESDSQLHDTNISEHIGVESQFSAVDVSVEVGSEAHLDSPSESNVSIRLSKGSSNDSQASDPRKADEDIGIGAKIKKKLKAMFFGGGKTISGSPDVLMPEHIHGDTTLQLWSAYVATDVATEHVETHIVLEKIPVIVIPGNGYSAVYGNILTESFRKAQIGKREGPNVGTVASKGTGKTALEGTDIMISDPGGGPVMAIATREVGSTVENEHADTMGASVTRSFPTSWSAMDEPSRYSKDKVELVEPGESSVPSFRSDDLPLIGPRVEKGPVLPGSSHKHDLAVGSDSGSSGYLVIDFLVDEAQNVIPCEDNEHSTTVSISHNDSVIVRQISVNSSTDTRDRKSANTDADSASKTLSRASSAYSVTGDPNVIGPNEVPPSTSNSYASQDVIKSKSLKEFEDMDGRVQTVAQYQPKHIVKDNVDPKHNTGNEETTTQSRSLRITDDINAGFNKAEIPGASNMTSHGVSRLPHETEDSGGEDDISKRLFHFTSSQGPNANDKMDDYIVIDLREDPSSEHVGAIDAIETPVAVASTPAAQRVQPEQEMNRSVAQTERIISDNLTKKDRVSEISMNESEPVNSMPAQFNPLRVREVDAAVIDQLLPEMEPTGLKNNQAPKSKVTESKFNSESTPLTAMQQKTEGVREKESVDASVKDIESEMNLADIEIKVESTPFVQNVLDETRDKLIPVSDPSGIDVEVTLKPCPESVQTTDAEDVLRAVEPHHTLVKNTDTVVTENKDELVSNTGNVLNEDTEDASTSVSVPPIKNAKSSLGQSLFDHKPELLKITDTQQQKSTQITDTAVTEIKVESVPNMEKSLNETMDAPTSISISESSVGEFRVPATEELTSGMKDTSIGIYAPSVEVVKTDMKHTATEPKQRSNTGIRAECTQTVPGSTIAINDASLPISVASLTDKESGMVQTNLGQDQGSVNMKNTKEPQVGLPQITDSSVTTVKVESEPTFHEVTDASTSISSSPVKQQTLIDPRTEPVQMTDTTTTEIKVESAPAIEGTIDAPIAIFARPVKVLSSDMKPMRKSQEIDIVIDDIEVQAMPTVGDMPNESQDASSPVMHMEASTEQNLMKPLSDSMAIEDAAIGQTVVRSKFETLQKTDTSLTETGVESAMTEEKSRNQFEDATVLSVRDLKAGSEQRTMETGQKSVQRSDSENEAESIPTVKDMADETKDVSSQFSVSVSPKPQHEAIHVTDTAVTEIKVDSVSNMEKMFDECEDVPISISDTGIETRSMPKVKKMPSKSEDASLPISTSNVLYAKSDMEKIDMDRNTETVHKTVSAIEHTAMESHLGSLPITDNAVTDMTAVPTKERIPGGALDASTSTSVSSTRDVYPGFEQTLIEPKSESMRMTDTTITEINLGSAPAVEGLTSETANTSISIPVPQVQVVKSDAKEVRMEPKGESMQEMDVTVSDINVESIPTVKDMPNETEDASSLISVSRTIDVKSRMGQTPVEPQPVSAAMKGVAIEQTPIKSQLDSPQMTDTSVTEIEVESIPTVEELQDRFDSATVPSLQHFESDLKKTLEPREESSKKQVVVSTDITTESIKMTDTTITEFDVVSAPAIKGMTSETANTSISISGPQVQVVKSESKNVEMQPKGESMQEMDVTVSDINVESIPTVKDMPNETEDASSLISVSPTIDVKSRMGQTPVEPQPVSAAMKGVAIDQTPIKSQLDSPQMTDTLVTEIKVESMPTVEELQDRFKGATVPSVKHFKSGLEETMELRQGSLQTTGGSVTDVETESEDTSKYMPNETMDTSLPISSSSRLDAKSDTEQVLTVTQSEAVHMTDKPIDQSAPEFSQVRDESGTEIKGISVPTTGESQKEFENASAPPLRYLKLGLRKTKLEQEIKSANRAIDETTFEAHPGSLPITDTIDTNIEPESVPMIEQMPNDTIDGSKTIAVSPTDNVESDFEQTLNEPRTESIHLTNTRIPEIRVESASATGGLTIETSVTSPAQQVEVVKSDVEEIRIEPIRKPIQEMNNTVTEIKVDSVPTMKDRPNESKDTSSPISVSPVIDVKSQMERTVVNPQPDSVKVKEKAIEQTVMKSQTEPSPITVTSVTEIDVKLGTSSGLSHMTDKAIEGTAIEPLGPFSITDTTDTEIKPESVPTMERSLNGTTDASRSIVVSSADDAESCFEQTGSQSKPEAIWVTDTKITEIKVESAPAIEGFTSGTAVASSASQVEVVKEIRMEPKRKTMREMEKTITESKVGSVPTMEILPNENRDISAPMSVSPIIDVKSRMEQTGVKPQSDSLGIGQKAIEQTTMKSQPESLQKTDKSDTEIDVKLGTTMRASHLTDNVIEGTPTESHQGPFSFADKLDTDNKLESVPTREQMLNETMDASKPIIVSPTDDFEQTLNEPKSESIQMTDTKITVESYPPIAELTSGTAVASSTPLVEVVETDVNEIRTEPKQKPSQDMEKAVTEIDVGSVPTMENLLNKNKDISAPMSVSPIIDVKSQMDQAGVQPQSDLSGIGQKAIVQTTMKSQPESSQKTDGSVTGIDVVKLGRTMGELHSTDKVIEGTPTESHQGPLSLTGKIESVPTMEQMLNETLDASKPIAVSPADDTKFDSEQTLNEPKSESIQMTDTKITEIRVESFPAMEGLTSETVVPSSPPLVEVVESDVKKIELEPEQKPIQEMDKVVTELKVDSVPTMENLSKENKDISSPMSVSPTIKSQTEQTLVKPQSDSLEMKNENTMRKSQPKSLQMTDTSVTEIEVNLGTMEESYNQFENATIPSVKDLKSDLEQKTMELEQRDRPVNRLESMSTVKDMLNETEDASVSTSVPPQLQQESMRIIDTAVIESSVDKVPNMEEILGESPIHEANHSSEQTIIESNSGSMKLTSTLTMEIESAPAMVKLTSEEAEASIVIPGPGVKAVKSGQEGIGMEPKQESLPKMDKAVSEIKVESTPTVEDMPSGIEETSSPTSASSIVDMEFGMERTLAETGLESIKMIDMENERMEPVQDSMQMRDTDRKLKTEEPENKSTQEMGTVITEIKTESMLSLPGEIKNAPSPNSVRPSIDVKLDTKHEADESKPRSVQMAGVTNGQTLRGQEQGSLQITEAASTEIDDELVPSIEEIFNETKNTSPAISVSPVLDLRYSLERSSIEPKEKSRKRRDMTVTETIVEAETAAEEMTDEKEDPLKATSNPSTLRWKSDVKQIEAKLEAVPEMNIANAESKAEYTPTVQDLPHSTKNISLSAPVPPVMHVKSDIESKPESVQMSDTVGRQTKVPQQLDSDTVVTEIKVKSTPIMEKVPNRNDGSTSISVSSVDDTKPGSGRTLVEKDLTDIQIGVETMPTLEKSSNEIKDAPVTPVIDENSDTRKTSLKPIPEPVQMPDTDNRQTTINPQFESVQMTVVTASRVNSPPNMEKMLSETGDASSSILLPPIEGEIAGFERTLTEPRPESITMMDKTITKIEVESVPAVEGSSIEEEDVSIGTSTAPGEEHVMSHVKHTTMETDLDSKQSTDSAIIEIRPSSPAIVTPTADESVVTAEAAEKTQTTCGRNATTKQTPVKMEVIPEDMIETDVIDVITVLESKDRSIEGEPIGELAEVGVTQKGVIGTSSQPVEEIGTTDDVEMNVEMVVKSEELRETSHDDHGETMAVSDRDTLPGAPIDKGLDSESGVCIAAQPQVSWPGGSVQTKNDPESIMGKREATAAFESENLIVDTAPLHRMRPNTQISTIPSLSDDMFETPSKTSSVTCTEITYPHELKTDYVGTETSNRLMAKRTTDTVVSDIPDVTMRTTVASVEEGIRLDPASGVDEVADVLEHGRSKSVSKRDPYDKKTSVTAELPHSTFSLPSASEGEGDGNTKHSALSTEDTMDIGKAKEQVPPAGMLHESHSIASKDKETNGTILSFSGHPETAISENVSDMSLDDSTCRIDSPIFGKPIDHGSDNISPNATIAGGSLQPSLITVMDPGSLITGISSKSPTKAQFAAGDLAADGKTIAVVDPSDALVKLRQPYSDDNMTVTHTSVSRSEYSEWKDSEIHPEGTSGEMISSESPADSAGAIGGGGVRGGASGPGADGAGQDGQRNADGSLAYGGRNADGSFINGEGADGRGHGGPNQGGLDGSGRGSTDGFSFASQGSQGMSTEDFATIGSDDGQPDDRRGFLPQHGRYPGGHGGYFNNTDSPRDGTTTVTQTMTARRSPSSDGGFHSDMSITTTPGQEEGPDATGIHRMTTTTTTTTRTGFQPRDDLVRAEETTNVYQARPDQYMSGGPGDMTTAGGSSFTQRVTTRQTGYGADGPGLRDGYGTAGYGDGGGDRGLVSERTVTRTMHSGPGAGEETETFGSGGEGMNVRRMVTETTRTTGYGSEGPHIQEIVTRRGGRTRGNLQTAGTGVLPGQEGIETMGEGVDYSRIRQDEVTMVRSGALGSANVSGAGGSGGFRYAGGAGMHGEGFIEEQIESISEGQVGAHPEFRAQLSSEGGEFGVAHELRVAETESLEKASREETQFIQILSVRDPRDDSDISFDDAKAVGILNLGEGMYVNPDSGETIPISAAMTQGLIKMGFKRTQRSREEKSTIGIITVKTIRHAARDYDVKTVTDTLTGEKLPQKDAESRGILDSQHGIFTDRQSRREMLIADAIEKGLVDAELAGGEQEPEVISTTYAVRAVVDLGQKKQITFAQAVKRGIIDKENGAFKNTRTGETMYVGDAIAKGFLKARKIEAKHSLDVDPANKMVIDKTEKLRKRLLQPLGVISAFRRAAQAAQGFKK